MKLTVRRQEAADFVNPPADARRLDRMWAHVARAERARPRRRVVLAALAAALVAGAAGFFFVHRGRPAVVAKAEVVDTGGSGQSLLLAEGSKLEMGPATNLTIAAVGPTEVRLELRAGTVGCEVSHQPSRRFVVVAGTSEVEARGTRFHVTRGSGVSVTVEDGIVEVRDLARGSHALLRAGQSLLEAPDQMDASSAPVIDPLTEPSSEPAAATTSGPPPVPTQTKAPLTAAALFQKADAARLDGRNAEAAAALAQLVRSYPGDGRAGLAAYELGRIRLASLGDPAGAIGAFSFAIDHAGDATFGEDAEASRVDAAQALGDTTRCRAFRDSFRAHYPGSARVTRLNKLCGP